MISKIDGAQATLTDFFDLAQTNSSNGKFPSKGSAALS